jgi:hypothetical protein
MTSEPYHPPPKESMHAVGYPGRQTILPEPLTLEHAMATILAIDLGMCNSVFCWYDSLTKMAG